MSKEAKQYGLYLGVISVVISAILYATGLIEFGQNDPFQSVVSIVMIIVFFILAGVAQKKRQDGYLSYGEGFKTMLGVGVISTLFSLLWMVVMMTVLEPDYQETILDNTYEQMVEQNPEMSDEQVDMALEMTERFVSPTWMVLWVLFGGIIMAAFFAAILAIFVKKNKPPFTTLDSQETT